MKKVAILTIVSLNYGNRLQNYALQEIIKNMGYNVETILREKKSIMKKMKCIVRRMVKKDKVNLFYDFNKDNINWSKEIISKNYVTKNINSLYYKYVIGSDQIWNIKFDFISDLDFLPMVEKKNKISYAASFGISMLPSDKEKKVANLVRDIEYISVREQSAVNIVNKICDREATLVLDPTLLVESSKWKKIEKKPVINLNNNFLVCYFIGDGKVNKYVKKLAKERNLEIINIIDNSLPIGPSEFIYLINNADLICTDSFHASVFSFIFEKPFIIFERQDKYENEDCDMSSRIDTFCKTFNFDKHRFCNEIFSLEDALKGDYSASKKILEVEKRKSLDFLMNALSK